MSFKIKEKEGNLVKYIKLQKKGIGQMIRYKLSLKYKNKKTFQKYPMIPKEKLKKSEILQK